MDETVIRVESSHMLLLLGRLPHKIIYYIFPMKINVFIIVISSKDSNFSALINRKKINILGLMQYLYNGLGENPILSSTVKASISITHLISRKLRIETVVVSRNMICK